MKSKKGFTLVELSVAMAVSAVAMSMLAVCFVAINSFFQKKELQAQYLTELSTFKTQFELALEPLQTTNYVITENELASPTITITSISPAEEHTISFSNNALFYDQTKLCEFSKITFAEFNTKTIPPTATTQTSYLINCKITYGENTITYVFAKRC